MNEWVQLEQTCKDCTACGLCQGRTNMVFGVGKKDVVIDNLRIKYYGRFGVSMCANDNTTITNCEFGFIGGAIHGGTTRLGNGIQAWDGAVGHKVENCWLYQVSQVPERVLL